MATQHISSAPRTPAPSRPYPMASPVTASGPCPINTRAPQRTSPCSRRANGRSPGSSSSCRTARRWTSRASPSNSRSTASRPWARPSRRCPPPDICAAYGAWSASRAKSAGSSGRSGRVRPGTTSGGPPPRPPSPPPLRLRCLSRRPHLPLRPPSSPCRPPWWPQPAPEPAPPALAGSQAAPTAPAAPTLPQQRTPAIPAPDAPSPAYLALARLGRIDSRLALSAADCAALEARAAEWLARGVDTDYLTQALVAGLPERVSSPWAWSAAASPTRSPRTHRPHRRRPHRTRPYTA